MAQAEVVQDIAGRFGEEFTYLNDNGNRGVVTVGHEHGRAGAVPGQRALA
jgi:hypothetical protein